MNDQEGYVLDASDDNMNPAMAEAPQEKGAPAKEAESTLTIPSIAVETVVPEEIAEASDLPTLEVSPGVNEAARHVFSSETTKPIAITLYLLPTAKHGNLFPKATVEIDPSLRTSGLLAALPGEEVKTLVALLTFVSPNGDIKPTAYEVAQSLNISEPKAKERLSRLLRFQWQSRPLIATLWRETGMDGYTLTHDAVSYRQAPPSRNTNPQPVYRAAGRDAVIAHSRAWYARPRAEVERQIAMLQGWPLPEEQNQQAGPAAVEGVEEIAVDYLLQRLLRFGVTMEQAQILLETFTPEEIEQQITWLPYRGAKNPASYLVAAVTGQYEEPGLLRMRREQQQGYDEPSPPSARAESAPPDAVQGLL
jgi:hypothetical protein